MSAKNEQPQFKTPFSAALSFFLEKKGWGAATAIAKKVGVKPSYISELASARKDGKEETRRAVALECGHNYENFLDLGVLLLEGCPPEDVVLISEIYRQKKSPGQFTPEEKAAVEKYLVPRWADGIAAWKERLTAQQLALEELAPKPEARSAFDVIMDGCLGNLKLWWRTARGDDEQAALAFTATVYKEFPEFAEWLANRPDIKNPAERGLEPVEADAAPEA